MVNDTIADMLTRIRNANLAKHQIVQVPATKMTRNIVQVLKEEGYIENFSINNQNNKDILEVKLKYYSDNPVIESIRRISKPGLRIYKSSQNLPDVMNGLGIAIVTTSKGVMTGKTARQLGIGGELLCVVV